MKSITFFISLFFYSSTYEGKIPKVKIEVKQEVKVLPQKNIIIGDSQSLFVDWGSERFNLISKTSGQSSLWLGGKTLS